MRSLRDVLTLTRPMLGVDLETTGTGPDARIVELGLEIMLPDKPTKEYRTLVNPQMPIPAGATAVHGIKDADVANAPTFRQLADNLLKGMTGADFAGYNVRFDLRRLAFEFKRAGKTWSYDESYVLDGFRLWQVAEARSLEDAHRRWLKAPHQAEHAVPPEELEAELGEDQAHTALWDVKVATRVIAAQLAQHPQLPRDAKQLHDLCWPGWFDADGKLKFIEGELCIAFGEHRDKPLRTVPEGYLNWVLKKDFTPKVKDAVRAALKGELLAAPITPDMDPDDE